MTAPTDCLVEAAFDAIDGRAIQAFPVEGAGGELPTDSTRPGRRAAP